MDKKKEIEKAAQFYIDKMETDRCKICNDYPCKCDEEIMVVDVATIPEGWNPQEWVNHIKHHKNVMFFDKIKSIKLSIPTYTLGIDEFNNIFSYCLVRKKDNIIDVLLTKSLDNKKEFDKEVKFLSKIFNATIIKEK